MIFPSSNNAAACFLIAILLQNSTECLGHMSRCFGVYISHKFVCAVDNLYRVMPWQEYLTLPVSTGCPIFKHGTMEKPQKSNHQHSNLVSFWRTREPCWMDCQRSSYKPLNSWLYNKYPIHLNKTRMFVLTMPQVQEKGDTHRCMLSCE